MEYSFHLLYQWAKKELMRQPYTYWTFHIQTSFFSHHSNIKKVFWFLCLLFMELSPCCSKFCFLTLNNMVLYFLMSFQRPQRLKNWITSYYCWRFKSSVWHNVAWKLKTTVLQNVMPHWFRFVNNIMEEHAASIFELVQKISFWKNRSRYMGQGWPTWTQRWST